MVGASSSDDLDRSVGQIANVSDEVELSGLAFRMRAIPDTLNPAHDNSTNPSRSVLGSSHLGTILTVAARLPIRKPNCLGSGGAFALGGARLGSRAPATVTMRAPVKTTRNRAPERILRHRTLREFEAREYERDRESDLPTYASRCFGLRAPVPNLARQRDHRSEGFPIRSRPY